MTMRLKMLPLLALAMLSTGAAPRQQETIPHCHMIGPFVLFFERGSTVLNQRSREVLDATQDMVTDNECLGAATLRLDGHTDKGEREAIARKRAEVARNYLVTRGVAASRIKVEPFESCLPRMFAKDRHENQRVEISFNALEQPLVAIPGCGLR